METSEEEEAAEDEEEEAASDDDEKESSSSSSSSLKEAAEGLLADAVSSEFLTLLSSHRRERERAREKNALGFSKREKKTHPISKKNEKKQETTERATKEFQRAHRRALAGFLLPTTPPFSNYSASLGNSSTGVTGE